MYIYIYICIPYIHIYIYIYIKLRETHANARATAATPFGADETLRAVSRRPPEATQTARDSVLQAPEDLRQGMQHTFYSKGFLSIARDFLL